MKSLSACSHCRAMRTRDQPQCLVCGFNTVTRQVEPIVVEPIRSSLNTLSDLADAFAVQIERFRTPRYRVPRSQPSAPVLGPEPATG